MQLPAPQKVRVGEEPWTQSNYTRAFRELSLVGRGRATSVEILLIIRLEVLIFLGVNLLRAHISVSGNIN